MRSELRIVGLLAGVLFVLGGVLGVDAVAGAKKEPKGKISIDGCKQKKPAVAFDHGAHVKAMKKAGEKCVSCHHLVDKKEAKKDKCSDCHQKAQAKLGSCTDKSKTKNPFHVQCIGCHKKKNDPKAPTKCKACHPK